MASERSKVTSIVALRIDPAPLDRGAGGWLPSGPQAGRRDGLDVAMRDGRIFGGLILLQLAEFARFFEVWIFTACHLVGPNRLIQLTSQGCAANN